MSNFYKSFVFVAFWYVIQGAVNGAGYHKSYILQVIAGLVQIILCAYAYRNAKLLQKTLYGVAALCSVFTIISFHSKAEIFDIHLWTSIGAYAFLVASMFVHPIGAILAVYPALILEKGLINLGGGLNFFDMRTDDPTGETFGIPFLGIKVPRNSLTIRLVLAVISALIVLGWEKIFKNIYAKSVKIFLNFI